jgi:tRNA threonylcarbamoyladenosine biosynthesis protein TsaE
MEPSTALAAGDAELLVSRSPEQTLAIGRALGRAAAAANVLALHGALGAGKTQLAKGVAEGLGVSSVVNSPTFVLVNEHHGRLPLFHVDAYRLSDPEEAAAAGLFDERQAQGVTVIEWAERLAGWLPDERLEVVIEHPAGGPATERRLRLSALGAAHRPLAEAARRVTGDGSP